MGQQVRQPAGPLDRSGTEAAWAVARAAARAAEACEARGRHVAFGLDGDELRPLPVDDPEAIVEWQPGAGWRVTLPADDPRSALVDLYLPICSATRAHPITVGHLGQSLDGFIATTSGDSQYVTGEENILHLHRLRALCDAVVVGPGTVALDNPQLTTRQVSGPSPLRVVLDPTRRLSADFRVFQDQSASTLYVCARSRVAAGETTLGYATVVGLGEGPAGLDLAELVRLLHDRGCARIFVEGGGVTVSAFLEAHLLDRLQVAIAPFIIGDGRPAIRLPGPVALRDCIRPHHRVFRMGTDVLFDCDLSADAGVPAGQPDTPPVTRIL